MSYVWFKLITCRSLVLIAAYLDIILQKIKSTPSEPNSGVIGVIDGTHKSPRKEARSIHQQEEGRLLERPGSTKTQTG